MITFKARMYDASVGEYIDNSPIDYSIATCTNRTKIAQLNLATDSGKLIHNFDLLDFDCYDPIVPTNIAFCILEKAYQLHEQDNVWHELRLCKSNSFDDYVLIWNHDAPNNLTIIENGTTSVFEFAIPWSTFINNPNPIQTHGFTFTTSYTIEGLNVDSLLWLGSVCANNVTGAVDTYMTYMEASITIKDSAYYAYYAGESFGRAGDRHFYKSNNGSCLVYFRDYTTGTKYKGPVTLQPYANIHNESTGTDTRGSAFSGWDGKFTPGNSGNPMWYFLLDNIWWGSRNDYAVNASYDAAGWPLFQVPSSQYLKEIATSIISQAVEVTFRNHELYEYLQGTFTPLIPDSDVDPEDIPPVDEPPTPIPPDDTNPYYDPVADPDSPQYDPTQNPTDPDYDPTIPHDPWKPPTSASPVVPAPAQPPQDTIDIPVIPPAFVTNNAMFTLYNPSGGDLNNLAAFLWSPAWSVDTFKKIFANPLDCILGLMVMPLLPATVNTKEMSVGNIATGVTMHYFTNQFHDFDCGTFTIEEFYMSYLDYAPYTKVSIYLPYIGAQSLDTDEVMGKTVGVKYRFDLATGDCVAFVTIDGSVFYTYSGNCASRLPLSGNNWNGIVPAVTTAMVGGVAAGVPALGAAAALAVSSMKQNIAHSGSMTGSPGLMGIQKPYLIITRPRQAMPLAQNSFTGYPSFITENMGGLSGYTEIESCHLEHIPCTAQELEEIENLLKEGVLF